MIPNSPIRHLNCIINQTAALLELEHFNKLAVPYSEARGTVKGWDIIRGIDLPYGRKLAESLGVPFAKPRYYILEPNIDIPVHVDVDTLCSLNFILDDEEPAPVHYPGLGNFTYKKALIDTSLPHGVINGNHPRILLKLSIKEYSFNEMVSILQERGLIDG